MERSLVLVKPDGVQRGLIGEAIARFERRGLRLVAAKFIWVSKDLAEAHYAEHKGKGFYDGLIDFIKRLPDEGFLRPEHERCLLIDDSLSSLMEM